ncbi:Rpn family recombination-promoting nuclease/putative transposase [Candidatus Finniella inopinata]|uniref:Rpn family recombination-promoting nuclease/putative transposase n=1 Tax=Candidatus Finniella inopinata TaxID=1696036 RepID=A0A4Q7DHI5_9PROT|nr:Rpn family recombination-promoting nuclease/putative transposase [Candidatus Finniella inopinata]RZI45748.1 Rpn family recombination-promoting nuclease/putative transposase [Candidatus Finniella inopinata]
MLTKFLDPKNDVAFRRIFGTERNKDILIDFLNDMITFKEKATITDVTFLKTVQDPEVAARKTSIVDVLCTDQNGHTYVVEMQVAKEKGFEKRAQYYAAKAYASQLKVAGKYYTLKEVIFLAITNFVMFPDKQAYKSDHIILDKVSHEHDLKDFSFTFLELPKLDKSLEESTTKIEKWVYFFKHGEGTPEKDVEHLLKNTNTLYRAYEELNRFSWSEQELMAYEQAEKQEADYIAAIDQAIDDGIERGRTEGRAEGRAEGRQEGREEANLETVLTLLKMGLSDDDIIKATQLTPKQLEILKLGQHKI